MPALALCLAACANVEQEAAVAFRPGAAPIWSAAAFVPRQIEGSWQQVAGFAARAEGTCDGGALVFVPAAGGFAVSGELCLNGTIREVAGLAQPSGPGRLTVAGEEEWWVLWVDSGYRTMAIGTPSGQFGFVLDRSGAAADRLTAAREIFDFNGYVAGALRAY